MNDILPDEIVRWHRVEAIFRARAELHGYGEVRTPIIESTELFAKEVGESTDIVEKEMYSFERHGDKLTVRPEGTASAARAYVEHGMHAKEPVTRWYYLGPMFRGERPAKGRYRQFYQAGCELYGDGGPIADAEMIDLACGLLSALGVPDFVVHLNSLGGAETRARYRDALLAYFTPKKAELSADSQRRLEKNPLRILDSKDPRDRVVAASAPALGDMLGEDDRAHFSGLTRALEALGVRFIVDPTLVRGLDYYTRTLFEVKTTAGDLGSQNTLVGGGRYDGMIESLGGPKIPAIGFAMGMERILSITADAASRPKPGCYLAPMNDAAAEHALLLARDLRALGVYTELDARGSRMKGMLRRADAMGARLCVLIGESELERRVLTVKDLAARSQDEIPAEGAATILADRVTNATRDSSGARGSR